MHRLVDSISRLVRLPLSRSASRPLKIKWVLPGHLAVGRAIRPGEESFLTQAGIQTVLMLCHETEAAASHELKQRFRHLYYPIPDSRSPTPLQPKDIITAVKLIHSSIAQQHPVYVHCLAGMERSPTICIAYLCLYHGYNIHESLAWLKEINPRTMPTDAQLSILHSLVLTRNNYHPTLTASQSLS